MQIADLKEKVKSLGIYSIGLAFIVIVILIIAIIVAGATVVSEFLHPIFLALTGISLLIFLIIILPLSLINRLRKKLAIISGLLSTICGVGIWMYSLVILTDFGLIGCIIAAALFMYFRFRFVAPTAVIGLFIKGKWPTGVLIIAGLLITYGMRRYGMWLENLYNRKIEDKMTDVIDV